MKGMVLAAGLGTRLGGLASQRPKPLLPVCDQPLARYALALLAGAGIGDVVVNVHHLGALIEAELGDGADLGLRIGYSREPRILGTGGGVRAALDRLSPDGAPFALLNGKIVFDLELAQVAAAHAGATALATLVVREDPDAARWGAITVDADGRVVGILDARAPDPGRPPLRACMFTGVQLVEPAAVRPLPPGEERCIVRDVYVPALRAGAPLRAVIASGYFQEHSTPRRYLEGNVSVLRGRAGLRHAPGPLVGVDPTARLGAGARVEEPVRIGPGAELGAGAVVGPDVVVGRRARIGAGARLRRAVVWADAEVADGADLDEVIVTPAGLFPVTG